MTTNGIAPSIEEIESGLRDIRRDCATMTLASVACPVAVLATTIMTDASRVTTLMMTASVIMIAWGNRRAARTTTKYVRLLRTAVGRTSRGTIVSIVAMDALSLTTPLVVATYLVYRLTSGGA